MGEGENLFFISIQHSRFQGHNNNNNLILETAHTTKVLMLFTDALYNQKL